MDTIFSNDTFSVISVIAALVGIITAIITYLMSKISSKTRYNEELKRIEMESMRKSFEIKLYELTNRLMMSEQRWKDTNHLLISSQNYNKELPTKNESVHLSEFLKSAGITQQDLISDKRLVFVLTPFNEKYFKIYDVIRDICTSVGIKCIRGDEEFLKSDILPHILRQLVKSAFVIANIDGRNPNVFYELGIAHALDKPTILVGTAPEKLTIDIQSKRFVFYEGKPTEVFREELKNEIMKVLIR